MRTAVFVKERLAGDSGYTFQVADAAFLNAVLLWVRGAADAASWAIGTPKARQDAPSETTTTTAPGVAVTTAPALTLGFFMERTTADEASVSVSGAQEWFFAPQSGSAVVTHAVTYADATAPGTTDPVVVTYPNTQATNGWGFQIAIPGAVA